jgi:hypothetical protein
MRSSRIAARVELAVREMQGLDAPHIGEAADDAMTALEQQMASSDPAARASLAELSQLLGSAGTRSLPPASTSIASLRRGADRAPGRARQTRIARDPLVLRIATQPCSLQCGARDAALRTTRRAGTHDASALRMDFMALAIAVGFFAASWGFVALCDRLRS